MAGALRRGTAAAWQVGEVVGEERRGRGVSEVSVWAAEELIVA